MFFGVTMIREDPSNVFVSTYSDNSLCNAQSVSESFASLAGGKIGQGVRGILHELVVRKLPLGY